MSDSDGVVHKVNTEGADLLTLAGVNDANLIELARLSGVKVALRGDTLTLSGPLQQVERAATVARRMIDTAKQVMALTPDDVLRMSDDPAREGDGGGGNGLPGIPGAARIVLAGMRRIITPKTAGNHIERIYASWSRSLAGSTVTNPTNAGGDRPPGKSTS